MNTEIELSKDDALPWLMSSLRAPLAKTFSKMVAAQNDWSRKSSFRVFADAGISHSELLDFDHGGKTSLSPNTDDWLVSYANKIRDSDRSFFLVEDWTLKPDARIIKSRALPAAFYNKEVYFAVTQKDPRATEDLYEICCANPSPLFHGFVIQHAPAPQIWHELEERQLRCFVRNVIMIYVGVYDGESYLACTFE